MTSVLRPRSRRSRRRPSGHGDNRSRAVRGYRTSVPGIADVPSFAVRRCRRVGHHCGAPERFRRLGHSGVWSGRTRLLRTAASHDRFRSGGIGGDRRLGCCPPDRFLPDGIWRRCLRRLATGTLHGNGLAPDFWSGFRRCACNGSVVVCGRPPSANPGGCAKGVGTS